MKLERTVILIKPDGIQRGLIGNIISRFEHKGLKLVGIKMLRADSVLLDEHYHLLKGKPFFSSLKKYMGSSPIIAMLWEGIEAVRIVRSICGATSGREADIGTIRGDLSMSHQVNIVHASDSLETAIKEKKRFFNEDEIFDYRKDEYFQIYAEDEWRPESDSHE
mgnify:CR=1 FL=1